MKSLKLAILISVALIGTSAVFAVGAARPKPQAVKLSGEWVDQSGRAFSNDRLQGQVTLMTLAYSTCRTLCPMIGARVKKLDESLLKQGIKTKIVLVSIDPENETPESLTAWMKTRQVLKDRWSFIKGSAEATLALAGQLQSGSLKMGFSDHRSPDHIPHTSYLAVLDPKGEIRDVIDLMQNDEALLASVEKSVR